MMSWHINNSASLQLPEACVSHWSVEFYDALFLGGLPFWVSLPQLHFFLTSKMNYLHPNPHLRVYFSTLEGTPMTISLCQQWTLTENLRRARLFQISVCKKEQTQIQDLEERRSVFLLLEKLQQQKQVRFSCSVNSCLKELCPFCFSASSSVALILRLFVHITKYWLYLKNQSHIPD